MRRLLPALFLVCAAGLFAQPERSLTAFVNVSVVSMEEDGVTAGQTVIVDRDHIVEIGPSARVRVPAGATRVEGANKFLMPALSEMHAHIPGGQASDAAMERVLTLYAMNGIGTIRGMLGHPRHLPLRDRAHTGALFSPTIYTSGPSFNANSVPDVAAAIRMVTEQQAAGYDFLKIHPGVKRDVFDALDATADKLGIRFAGHVPVDVGLDRALEAGYASIDHLDGYMEALVRPGAPVTPAQSQFFGLNLVEHIEEARIAEVVSKTRAARVAVVPTEILFESAASDEPPDAMAKWPEMRYADPAQVAQWVENKKKMLAGTPAPQRKRFIDVRRRLLKALHAGGVRVLLGSDAPQVWNVPGFSIHRELATYVAAGLTPYQALETGTKHVAAFFGTEKTTGTVARGKRADLVLVNGNPLADIANTSRIAGVMIRGRWMPRTELENKIQTELP